MHICAATHEPPAASAGQPMGVPGPAAWMNLRVPPYVGVTEAGAGAGFVMGAVGAVVGAGLAVVGAGAAVVVGDAAGFGAVAVVGAGVVVGVPQPITTATHIARVNRITINLFIFPPYFFDYAAK